MLLRKELEWLILVSKVLLFNLLKWARENRYWAMPSRLWWFQFEIIHFKNFIQYLLSNVSTFCDFPIFIEWLTDQGFPDFGHFLPGRNSWKPKLKSCWTAKSKRQFPGPISNPRTPDPLDGGIFIFEIPPELLLKIRFPNDQVNISPQVGAAWVKVKVQSLFKRPILKPIFHHSYV